MSVRQADPRLPAPSRFPSHGPSMFRLFFRFNGLLVFAVAFVALVVDGTRSIASGRIDLLPLGRACTLLAPDAFQKIHNAIEGHLPLLWDPVLVTILLLPSWVVFGATGMVLLASTRRRAPLIGYSRR